MQVVIRLLRTRKTMECMKDYELRAGVPADKDWLFDLYCRTMMPFIKAAWGWDDVFQSTSFSEHLAPSDWTIITVDQRGVGGFVLKENLDNLWLEMLLIEPDYQRGGIGRSIVQHLKDTSAGCRKPVQLSVIKSNPVMSFYESLGFNVFDEDNWCYKLQWQPE